MSKAGISAAALGNSPLISNEKHPRDQQAGPGRRQAVPHSCRSAGSPKKIAIERTSSERIKALHDIRDRHRGEACATQASRLLEALQTLQHVTTFEASRYLDLYDPRARKLNLVKAGHRILTTWRTVQTESGKHHRIGVYSLVRGAA